MVDTKKAENVLPAERKTKPEYEAGRNWDLYDKDEWGKCHMAIKTEDGYRLCKNTPVQGESFCYHHGGPTKRKVKATGQEIYSINEISEGDIIVEKVTLLNNSPDISFNNRIWKIIYIDLSEKAVVAQKITSEGKKTNKIKKMDYFPFAGFGRERSYYKAKIEGDNQ